MQKPRWIRIDGDGFSLIELLITFVILGILASVAIPVFSSWLPNYRLRSAGQDLLSNMQLAKLSAIRRNTNCVVTFNQADYIVSVDSNNNRVYDAGEDILTQKLLSDYEDVSFDTSQGGGDGIEFSNTPPSVAFLSNALPTEGDKNVFLKNTKGKTISVWMSAAGNIEIR